MKDEKKKEILWRVFLVATLFSFGAVASFFIVNAIASEIKPEDTLFQKEDNTANYLTTLNELQPEITLNNQHISGTIPASIDATLQRLEVPLIGADISIEAASITLFTTNMDVLIDLNDSIHLNDFSGTLKWANGMLMLEGEMQNYKATHTNINWRKKAPIVMTIDSGSVSTQNVAVHRLESVASGTIKAGPSTIDLHKNILTIDQYSGSLDLRLNGNNSRVVMEGIILNLTVVTKDTTITIQ